MNKKSCFSLFQSQKRTLNHLMPVFVLNINIKTELNEKCLDRKYMNNKE